MAPATASAALTPVVTPLVDTVAPEMASTLVPTARVPSAADIPMNWSRTPVPLGQGLISMTLGAMPAVSVLSTMDTPVTAPSASTPTIISMLPWEPEATTLMA